MSAITVVFVHGWSVTNLSTYGNLPARLREEGQKNGIDIQVEEIFLGRYISFHDEVRVPDISRAFNTALNDVLTNVTSFVCITHSAGAPVIREWWERYNKEKKQKYGMSHLVMLAPANFGSALAQLGKAKLSRLRSWWNKVEPGQGVLDWLELGSEEACTLNRNWILSDGSQIGPSGFFPFVLTGECIDRKFYDSLNSYTGEIGSDGVIRVASANLNATYIRLEQPAAIKKINGKPVTGDLKLTLAKQSPAVPFRVISSRSHSGNAMGIMLSVETQDEKSMETVNAIFDCIKVKTKKQFNAVISKFEKETRAVQKLEKIETEKRLLLADRYFIHDRYTMIIFRVTDTEGNPVNDYDLLLTAGKENDPNHLPEGFFADRQQNKRNKNTITYFVNYDIMQGTEEVKTKDGKILREQAPGIDMLGIILIPRPDEGFVKYIDCRYTATKKLFSRALNPNSTTLVDIILQRNIDTEVFRLETPVDSKNFSEVAPSDEFAD